MLRVFKVTSPMSVGSWLLAGYVPLAGIAAASSLSGRAPRIGMAATAGSGVAGPRRWRPTPRRLISNTAVPAWHDGYPEMPFVFVGSGATAAAGLGLGAAPVTQNGPSRAMAVFGVGTELAAFERMQRRIGMTAEPYSQGRGGGYLRAGKILSGVGLGRGTARQAQPGTQRRVRRSPDQPRRPQPGGGSSRRPASRRPTPSTPSFRSANG